MRDWLSPPNSMEIRKDGGRVLIGTWGYVEIFLQCCIIFTINMKNMVYGRISVLNKEKKKIISIIRNVR